MSDRYTYRQVESMLVRYLHERQQPDLHGKIGKGLKHIPNVDPYRRVSVNEAVIERADLFRALARLPHNLRQLLVLWYATDWSTDRIVEWYRKQPPYPGRRTVFRWREIAVRRLVRIMNGRG